ncbi:AAA family ATPase [Kitasatospora indigofera]|uniref:AAA family ATPase n=1 Tax=Kitasatospora indigofera TaxID=67307 RepID=UPI00324D817C
MRTAPHGGAEGPAGANASPYPRGLLDLRGHPGVTPVLRYPADAVVVISGLPGSGKSTLLRRWSAGAPVIDPRDVHLACEAVMPARLPYAVYRPWARLVHFRRLCTALARGGPLLVHDCGSRPWLRRWLAAGAARRGRELHLVLLDLSPADALAGQRERGRWASRRVFARHCRGLERLLRDLPPPAPGEPGGDPGGPAAGRPGTGGGSTPARTALPAALAETASVLLLDRSSREHATAAFGPAEADAAGDAAASQGPPRG